MSIYKQKDLTLPRMAPAYLSRQTDLESALALLMSARMSHSSSATEQLVSVKNVP
ncbi:hypothetical protein [Methylobacterium oryzae]|uniref:hypothetical protein n=1 Tax=Methylobacterium oryzae TaxID=334852 RepID=UPI002F35DF86